MNNTISDISSAKDLVEYCKEKNSTSSFDQYVETAEEINTQIAKLINRHEGLHGFKTELESSTLNIPGLGPIWSAEFLTKFLDEVTKLQPDENSAAKLIERASTSLWYRLISLSSDCLRLFTNEDPTMQSLAKWVDEDVNLEIELKDGTKLKMGPKDSLERSPLFKSLTVSQGDETRRIESRNINEHWFKRLRFFNAPAVDTSEPDKQPKYDEWVREDIIIDQSGAIFTKQEGNVTTKEEKLSSREYLIAGSTDKDRSTDPRILHTFNHHAEHEGDGLYPKVRMHRALGYERLE